MRRASTWSLCRAPGSVPPHCSSGVGRFARGPVTATRSALYLGPAAGGGEEAAVSDAPTRSRGAAAHSPIRGAFADEEGVIVTATPFHVELAFENSIPVVSAAGELDLSTVAVLDVAIDGIVGSKFPEVVVDLAKVTFLDSTALGCLIRNRNRCRSFGGDLSVVNPTEEVARVFDVTGLAGFFKNAEAPHG